MDIKSLAKGRRLPALATRIIHKLEAQKRLFALDYGCCAAQHSDLARATFKRAARVIGTAPGHCAQTPTWDANEHSSGRLKKQPETERRTGEKRKIDDKSRGESVHILPAIYTAARLRSYIYCSTTSKVARMSKIHSQILQSRVLRKNARRSGSAGHDLFANVQMCIRDGNESFFYNRNVNPVTAPTRKRKIYCIRTLKNETLVALYLVYYEHRSIPKDYNAAKANGVIIKLVSSAIIIDWMWRSPCTATLLLIVTSASSITRGLSEFSRVQKYKYNPSLDFLPQQMILPSADLTRRMRKKRRPQYETHEMQQFCSACSKNGIQTPIKLFQLNFKEATFMCSSEKISRGSEPVPRVSRLCGPGVKSALLRLHSLSLAEVRSSVYTCTFIYRVPPRFELGSLDSESRVLTITPWDPTITKFGPKVTTSRPLRKTGRAIFGPRADRNVTMTVKAAVSARPACMDNQKKVLGMDSREPARTIRGRYMRHDTRRSSNYIRRHRGPPPGPELRAGTRRLRLMLRRIYIHGKLPHRRAYMRTPRLEVLIGDARVQHSCALAMRPRAPRMIYRAEPWPFSCYLSRQAHTLIPCREPRCQARACVYTRNIMTRAAAIGAVELANVAVRVRARALVQCSRSHNEGGALWETSGAQIYTSTIENSTRTQRADILIIAKYSAITRRAHEPRRRHLRRDFISVAAKAIGTLATDSRDRNSYARELRTKQFSSCIVRVFVYKTRVLAGLLCCAGTVAIAAISSGGLAAPSGPQQQQFGTSYPQFSPSSCLLGSGRIIEAAAAAAVYALERPGAGPALGLASAHHHLHQQHHHPHPQHQQQQQQQQQQLQQCYPQHQQSLALQALSGAPGGAVALAAASSIVEQSPATMTPTSAPAAAVATAAATAVSPNNPMAMSQLGTVYATKRRRRNGKSNLQLFCRDIQIALSQEQEFAIMMFSERRETIFLAPDLFVN
ncbi:unnamed protein product, partial [Trichogramma brassicae]